MLEWPSGLICQFVGKENKYHVDDDDVTCLCRDDDDDCVCLLSFLTSSLTRLNSTRVWAQLTPYLEFFFFHFCDDNSISLSSTHFIPVPFQLLGGNVRAELPVVVLYGAILHGRFSTSLSNRMPPPPPLLPFLHIYFFASSQQLYSSPRCYHRPHSCLVLSCRKRRRLRRKLF